MKKFGLIRTALWFTAAGCLVACGDSASDDVAGGVTDIGNSIAGVVVDGSGKPVEAARVVAYYDSWDRTSIKDSVETVTDAKGAFEVRVAGSASFVLYAERDEDCALMSGFGLGAGDSAKWNMTIGERRTLTSRVLGKTAGYMRVVGSGLQAELEEDGTFSMEGLPPGEISLVYVENDSAQARLEFELGDAPDTIALPALEVLEANDTWLGIKDFRFYRDEGFGGIQVHMEEGVEVPPDTVLVTAPANLPEGFTYPVLISTVGIDSANMELLASGKAAPYEVEYWDSEEALLWVGVESEDETLAVLRMNGDVKVVGSDSAEASATADSAGLFGRGLTLAPGQYIDLGSLDPCVGDFTISLWTKWMGPNGEHQILVSQRAYWSDSTSRFQWHYEVNHGVFTVMKSMPNYPEAIVFGDSSIVPIGEWAHLALVSQGGVVTMYVNGEQVGESQEFTPNDLSRPVPLRVGGNEVDTETWNGALDEVRIETVARSAEWVKTAYEAGKSFAE